MFGKILAALDRSAQGEQVFQQALALAQINHANLLLLHVLALGDVGYPDFPPVPGIDTYYPTPYGEATVKSYLQAWQEYEQAGLEWLRSLSETATTAGVTTEVKQLLGNPGRVICEIAQQWGTDLILVGRRGRSGLGELFLGSVSNYVIHHAPCSVLTLQSAKTGPA